MKDSRLLVGLLAAGLFFLPVMTFSQSATDIGSLRAEEQLSGKSDPAKLRAKLAEIDARIKKEPTSAKLYAAKANVLVFLKDDTKALSAINKAIELSPNTGKYYAYKGLIYSTQGDAPETIKCIEKAKILGVSDPAYLGVLALAQAGTQDNKNAIKNAEAALKLDPTTFSAFYARGRVHANRKEYTKALNDFNLAIKQKDYLPEIFIERAAIWSKLGNKMNAESDKAYAEKLKLQPN